VGIFDTASSSSPRSVAVPPFVVYVGQITGAGSSVSWGAMTHQPRLKPINMSRGSSVTGMSEATLKLVPLATAGGDLDVTAGVTVLKRGDRVSIGVQEGESVRWLWAGYCVRDVVNVGEEAENRTWKCLGPEWFWGSDSPNAGAGALVYGQSRMLPDGDDGYLSDIYEYVVAFDEHALFTGLPTVFNPLGRPNAHAGQAKLTTGTPGIEGIIFTEPDKKIGTDIVAVHWGICDAARWLTLTFNDPAVTKIDVDDWAATETVLQSAGGQIRDVDVNGLSLWAALKRAIGPNYAFYVDPKPTDGAWGGFKLVFFARTSGDAASFTLNARGTAASAAVASVTRLQASFDVTKTATRAYAYGKRLRHIVLRYHGCRTTTLAAGKKPLSLQHGWTEAITDYAAGDPLQVDLAALDSLSKAEEWQERYTTKGSEFDKYKHVFRLFIWNEAGEWHGPGPTYAPNAGMDWISPDLADLFAPNLHTRRRRRLLDTIYRNTAGDEFYRVPPAVFLAYDKAEAANDGAESLTAWIKVASSNYRLDESRGALWFTHQDLAQWTPFLDAALENERDGSDTDQQTFATLLAQGRLRIAIECCVEDDMGLEGDSTFNAPTAGIPMMRKVVSFAGARYLKVTKYDDGQGFIMANSGDAIDDTDALTELAEQIRDAGQDATIHTSILAAADWPSQSIGKFITTIAGRNISLASSGTRATQIVAAVMDVEAMKWEYLTESAALALRQGMRRGTARKLLKKQAQLDEMSEDDGA